MSETKRAINRRNAQKSSGLRSSNGKAASSKNALRHGILGSGLLLVDENPADYDVLFQSLVQDLRPHGALEIIHVERIAAAIWRQRRLIRAETAAVAFRQAADDTRKMLTETLGRRTRQRSGTRRCCRWIPMSFSFWEHTGNFWLSWKRFP